MPALGVAMTEGLVLRWLKQPGEAVAEGEPILEIETDKSTVEVPSPAHGRVGPLLAAEGDMVPTGVVLTHVLEGSEELAGNAPAPAAEGARGAFGLTAAPVANLAAPAVAVPGDHAPAPAGTVPGERAPHRLSPRQRRIAREQAAASDRDVAEPTTGISAPPLRGRHRALIAARVTESWRSTPHFGVSREVDAEAMEALRRNLPAEARPSLTDLMVRALAQALRSSGASDPVDVGLAVATPEGVLIPVLRGVLDMDLASLRQAREAAVARARADRLLAADLEAPPRSTLSNLGTAGVDAFTGVIAPGQESLLTVGRVAPRPAVVEGQLTVRARFWATLNVDHRALDGDDAARILLAFVRCVEDPACLAGEPARP